MLIKSIYLLAPFQVLLNNKSFEHKLTLMTTFHVRKFYSMIAVNAITLITTYDHFDFIYILILIFKCRRCSSKSNKRQLELAL